MSILREKGSYIPPAGGPKKPHAEIKEETPLRRFLTCSLAEWYLIRIWLAVFFGVTETFTTWVVNVSVTANLSRSIKDLESIEY